MKGRASTRHGGNPAGFRMRPARLVVSFLTSTISHLCVAVVLIAALLTMAMAINPSRALIERVERHVETVLGDAHDLNIGDASWSLDRGGVVLSFQDVEITGSGDERPVVEVDTASVLLRPRSMFLAQWRLSEVALGTLSLRVGNGNARPDLAGLENVLRVQAPEVLRQLDAIGLEDATAQVLTIARDDGPIVLDRPAMSRGTDGFDVVFGVETRTGPARVHASIGSTAKSALVARTAPMPVSALFQRRSFATSALMGLTLSVPRDTGHPITLAAASDGGPVRLARKTMAFDAFSALATLNGGALDLADLDLRFGMNRVGGRGDLGFSAGVLVYDLDLHDTVLAPVDIASLPLQTDVELVGTFDWTSKRLRIDRAQVDAEGEAIDASGHVHFIGRSPEIALDLDANRIALQKLPTLWPAWIAAEGRDWMIRNVRGGVAQDARLAVRIASDRLHEAAGSPLRLEPGELRVSAKLDGASSLLFGDLPPLQGAGGEFAMSGRRMEVALERGALALATGASVSIEPSWLTVPDLAAPGLPVGFDIGLAGNADTMAALADSEPFTAMRRADLDPAALSGRTRVRVKGDVALKDAKRRDWSATINLDRVSLAQPVQGREIGDVTGVLTIDETHATLDADGTLDGVRARFSLNEPLVRDVPKDRRRGIAMSLDREAMDRFVPGLSDYVGGTVALSVQQTANGFSVEADLTDATLDFPWIGWRKGSGVTGRATFDVTAGPTPNVTGLVFSGEGFGARGTARFDAKGLASLDLSDVRLSPGDDFALSLKRRNATFVIDVQGERADMRSLVRKLDPRHATSASGNTIDLDVSVRLSLAVGFNEITLDDVTLDYASRNGALSKLTLRAAFANGTRLAVDGRGSNGSEDMFATSGDLGRTLRFFDLYTKMRGGKVTANAFKNDGIWRGFVDGSDIELVGESKLDVLAKRARRERGGTLDVGRVRFSRAFADFAYGAGQLEVSEAILRGPEIGAALDGVVIDANKNMNLRGTFLPAYGLNRVFSEVPVVGALLGNGKDKGLFGLTFRLSGPALRPTIEVNPLSLMAPGVFRNVFEYQP